MSVLCLHAILHSLVCLSPVTTQKPGEKLNSLKDGLQHLKLGGRSSTLKAWNFDVVQSPMIVKARLLEAPTLEFAECVKRGLLQR